MTTSRGPNATRKSPGARGKPKPVGKNSTKKRMPADGQALEPAAEDRPPSPLRGPLPTNPEIENAVEDILEGRPVTEAARQRIVDDFKLRYYFGGHWATFRYTPQGVEVLAVGLDEIGRLKRKRTPAAEREKVIVGFCDEWYPVEKSGSTCFSGF